MAAEAAVARLWVRRCGGHEQSRALPTDAQAGAPLVAAAVESRVRGRYTALSRVPVHSGGWTPAEGSTFTGHKAGEGFFFTDGGPSVAGINPAVVAVFARALTTFSQACPCACEVRRSG